MELTAYGLICKSVVVCQLRELVQYLLQFLVSKIVYVSKSGQAVRHVSAIVDMQHKDSYKYPVPAAMPLEYSAAVTPVVATMEDLEWFALVGAVSNLLIQLFSYTKLIEIYIKISVREFL
jgi:hypothetical protein